jgi:hypothetical protein
LALVERVGQQQQLEMVQTALFLALRQLLAEDVGDRETLILLV